MRWVLFIILGYAVVLIQTTIGRIVLFEGLTTGPFGPDFLAVVAVFVALNVRGLFDAMIAAWLLGLALDLTTGGAGRCVGPMALAYALAGGAVYQLREAFFFRRALPQMFLAMVFCFIAHGVYVTLQSLLAWNFRAYGRELVQVMLISLCTAVVMPVGHFLLHRCRRWIIAPAPGRSRGQRR